MTSQISQAYFQTLHESPAFGATGFDFAALREGMATRREPTVPGVRCTRIEAEGIACEWVMTPGADPGVRLLYLHGGGYVSGSGAYYLPLAAHLSAAAQCAVLLPDYRLAPEDPFPAAVEDCVRLHDWLRVSGPDGPGSATATFIAGDSAGGGLTLASLLVLRDRAQPLPAAGIALSAFADLTLSGESLRSEAELDPIMSPLCLPDFVALYLGGADARHPYASPVFGDYTGVPPLLLQVGEHEIIRDDSVATATKAEGDGVDVKLQVWPGLFHVFQSHEPLLPEAKEAVADIAAFMRERV
ncbi:MAG: alpha/beta hydrolase [Lentisphaerae bacterium]|jgi:epsilon-lactone hydrolase|nr:alpha/beta hydrolase [Lentisphaerota bacterium]MBT4822064.1 alpha/beta hydrolase [Lentisphaerota bacterium]MBT5609138.1 alpha/beta hydrolase [Lentisphaerota bacterium]MBT7054182.1 alpha/beta hydrolase [Lentisphaerota bacterium]MBT7843559.1 alpha/beta hydrolase [Lentisphaerota bacterium]